MKFLVMNGPNINLLGIREPELYGKETYQALLDRVRAACEAEGIKVEFFQSNHEGALVDRIQEAYFEKVDGIVINPAAYTHTSVALLDAVKAVKIPAVEVHISQVSEREEFRRQNHRRTGLGRLLSGGAVPQAVFAAKGQALEGLCTGKARKRC